jgi:hypothetical protein
MGGTLRRGATDLDQMAQDLLHFARVDDYGEDSHS